MKGNQSEGVMEVEEGNIAYEGRPASNALPVSQRLASATSIIAAYEIEKCCDAQHPSQAQKPTKHSNSYRNCRNFLHFLPAKLISGAIAWYMSLISKEYYF
jgi:hypothetical protein